jgi:chloride channel protein, CIC family
VESSSTSANGKPLPQPDRNRNAASLAILDRMQKHRMVRWGLFGVTVGILSGLMACVVFYLLEWTTFFSMESLAGYHTVKPAGEHLVDLVSEAPFRQWVLCLLPAIGGLLSGFIVYTWAPEAEGQ